MSEPMKYEYVFTIGCFDKLHKGHIKLLENLKASCSKLIVGIHDNKSIEKIKKIKDIQPLDIRIKNIQAYAHDTFVINSADPTEAIKSYIKRNFSVCEPCIKIGSSFTNTKVVKTNTTTKPQLHFLHGHKDTFTYSYDEEKNLTVTRTDNPNSGWGQPLVGYTQNWCYMRADDNMNFPAKNYVSSIMPIKYLPYSSEISATKLRDHKKDKVGAMNYLLKTVVNILKEHDLPYYLDCGTLLGCVRENGLMSKDTDVDVTLHLSMWKKLKAIDFKKYDLIVTRVLEGYPKKNDGNMISVKSKTHSIYCDIYTNPAFPLLTSTVLNGDTYTIPKNSDLYLTQLYGDWRVPSKTHASTTYHRGNGLVTSEYSKYWDPNYTIYECLM
jgi:cytidyltransferase-like protein